MKQIDSKKSVAMSGNGRNGWPAPWKAMVSVLAYSAVFLFALSVSGCSKDDDEDKKEETASKQTSGYINGHAYVDLGLPSGLKWATTNVGATSPIVVGGVYAWGETSQKTDYTDDTYQYYHDGEWESIGGEISGTSYDVARKLWGGSWRMPTYAEVRELYAHSSVRPVESNGVIVGIAFIGSNGNMLIMPYTHTEDGEDTGNFWTGTLNQEEPSKAYFFSFDSRAIYDGYAPRSNPFAIRPVSD